MACASDDDGRIYFFGGVGAAGTESILDISDDLWVYDTSIDSWANVPRSDPWPAARRCTGFVAGSGSIDLWGGSGVESRDGALSYNFMNDHWQFATSTLTWLLIEPSRVAPVVGRSTTPGERYTPILHRTDEGLFLFGGYTEDSLGKRKLNDAWIRRGSTWHEIPAASPAGYTHGAGWPGVRYGSQSATDGTSVYIFGGFSDDGDHNDLWVHRNGRFEMVHGDSTSPAVPLPRYCAAFDLHDGGLYLFGGRSRRDPKANYSDLWRFDIAERTWTEIHGHGTVDGRGSATPGYHAKSSVAVVEDAWYLWGGEGPRGHVSDFWSYSFTDRRWTSISPPRDDDPVFW